MDIFAPSISSNKSTNSSVVIHYPETVDVEISITATRAPMRLVAADTGINSRFRQLSLSESIQIIMSKKYTDTVSEDLRTQL